MYLITWPKFNENDFFYILLHSETPLNGAPSFSLSLSLKDLEGEAHTQQQKGSEELFSEKTIPGLTFGTFINHIFIIKIFS